MQYLYLLRLLLLDTVGWETFQRQRRGRHAQHVSLRAGLCIWAALLGPFFRTSRPETPHSNRHVWLFGLLFRLRYCQRPPDCYDLPVFYWNLRLVSPRSGGGCLRRHVRQQPKRHGHCHLFLHGVHGSHVGSLYWRLH